jgi:hypothetical protein
MRARRASLAALLLAALAAPTAHAQQPSDAGLSGQDIYARVLENRSDGFAMEVRMSSGDRVGRTQEARLTLAYKDFREGKKEAPNGVLSKALVKYVYPFDLRYTGFLLIQNSGRIDDHFVYLPSRRRTQRVNLRSKAVFGTDFSFEDIIPHELEDANYERLGDSTVDDAPVFVVEGRPTDLMDSEYSRFIFYVEKRRFVPLRVRYFDEAGVEVKELRTRAQDIEEFDGLFVPMKVSMRNLLLESFTNLEVLSFDPHPVLLERGFELRRLESESH